MRVVIGEDEALLRQGLALLLRQDGFDVVEVAPDAVALEEAVRAHDPDLVITDIRMPPSYTDEGLAAAVRIRSERPAMPVVVLSPKISSATAARGSDTC